MGYETLPYHRPIADTETSKISCLETQTEAAPIRKCERFWTQPSRPRQEAHHRRSQDPPGRQSQQRQRPETEVAPVPDAFPRVYAPD